jgi:hypothetical protein
MEVEVSETSDTEKIGESDPRGAEREDPSIAGSPKWLPSVMKRQYRRPTWSKPVDWTSTSGASTLSNST